MPLHKLIVKQEDGLVDVYASAVPPIAPGTVLYMQNISPTLVKLFEDNDVTAPFLLVEARHRDRSTVSIDSTTTTLYALVDSSTPGNLTVAT